MPIHPHSMKQIYLFSLLAVAFSLFSLSSAHSQPSSQVENSLKAAIQQGQAKDLVQYCNKDRVEITLNGQRQSYALRQAELVMADFFSKNPPSAFEVVHRGGTANTLYALGEYRSNNQVFEVYLFLREFEGSFRLDEIRFERQ